MEELIESHYSLEKQMYTLRESQILTENFTEFVKILRKITKNSEFFRKTPIGTKK